ncbi:MAG: hypothetical protein PHG66_00965 [Candidatus Colwellbacteria bacterium]|nr:hypothetical protein [Candidatus Colwellbacteria bacterium]
MDTPINTILYNCQYCYKEFTRKHNNDNHEIICPKKYGVEQFTKEIKDVRESYEKIINVLKDENCSLKIQLEKEKERGEIYYKLFSKEHDFSQEQSKKLLEKATSITTTTNIKAKNITMNSLNLSQERLESIKDTYTIKHYERGGVGQADWVVDNVIKDESGTLTYRCTDKNRKNFIYHDDKGNIVTDIQAKKLKEAILPIMSTKLKEFKKIKCAELAEISDDESELLEQYSNLYNENKSMGNEFDKRLVEKTYDK